MSTRIALIGAGDRGGLFSRMIAEFPELGRIVAVAEPRHPYRAAIADRHSIPASHCFTDWREIVTWRDLADAAIVATPDREHVGPAVACLENGWDLLLEKPMGVTLDECRQIESAQRQCGRIVGLCHSLRYHAGFRKLRDLVADGLIGKLITMDQLEQVEIRHQAHSFVRGNWASSKTSTFMLLAKSCHDIDYIAFLVGQPCLEVSSFGNLTFFKRETAPAGATDRCTDGCPVERSCMFSAIRQYVEADRTKWPANVASADHSEEAHLHAIRTGPYGRCVWKCDNDAVDHQMVAMRFAGDITATFTMTAFTAEGGRKIRLHGTQGELHFDEKTITHVNFADRRRSNIDIPQEIGGHGGGDRRVLAEWLAALHSRDASGVVADAQASLASHSIVFAAEQSRHEGRTIRL